MEKIARTGPYVQPSDCRDREEFSALQRVRGYLSGRARAARLRGRNSSIVTARKAGMKTLTLGLRFGLSEAQISRICSAARKAAAKVYPLVPDVLRRLFVDDGQRHYLNRLNWREEDSRRVEFVPGTASCLFPDALERFPGASVCCCCGRNLRKELPI